MSTLEIFVPAAADGADIAALARAIRLFSAEDVAVVDELWQAFLEKGAEASGYHWLAARADGEMAGFAVFGPRALTRSAFDLFWIGVSDRMQGQGIGRALLREVDTRVQALGGTLLIIETEGRAEYAPTRAFYERTGCPLEARIRDFYSPGNDLYVYTRRY